MNFLARYEPIDYLLIGNLTRDLTPKGAVLGGTAAYSALTAKALGMRVGVVTSCGRDFEIPELEGIQVMVVPAEHTTTFENIYTPTGRIQYLHQTAAILEIGIVPPAWRNAPIVHLGPIANEVSLDLCAAFPASLVGLTIQGWLRGWDGDRRVHFKAWPEAAQCLSKADAVVLSIEDVENNETWIDQFQAAAPVLAVTEGAQGARLFWKEDQRRFRPPHVVEVDPIGAGDIFATAFFYRLYQSRDPWEAARFATSLAACSVTRHGLQGIPTEKEIESCLVEILPRV